MQTNDYKLSKLNPDAKVFIPYNIYSKKLSETDSYLLSKLDEATELTINAIWKENICEAISEQYMQNYEEEIAEEIAEIRKTH